MFYSHTFLARKGPLGTVWCAAHLQHKLKKSHYTSTDISSTVERIMHPEVPIALRMSGHLLLGIVRIYSKQVDYLFQDCNAALVGISKAYSSANINLPEDATHAPFHVVTLPETFNLDAVELEDDFYQERSEDNHLKRPEEITLEDQIPTGADPYIVITLDEDMRKSFSGFEDAPGTGPRPTVTEEDSRPSIPVDSTAKLGDPSSSNQAGLAEKNIGNSSSRDLPEIETMRDAVHDFHADNNRMWPDQMDEVMEPDRILEEQILRDKETTTPHFGEMVVSGGPSLRAHQPRDPSSVASEQARGSLDLHVSIEHGSPELAIRSTPVGQPVARRRKRRRDTYDETTVLTNKFMKRALKDPSNLLREKRNCPSTSLEIWQLNKLLKKDSIFVMPSITGMSSELLSIYDPEFISSKSHLVSSSEVHQDADVPKSPPFGGDNEMEIEHLRNNEVPDAENVMSVIMPSPHQPASSPRSRGDTMTPTTMDFGSQSGQMKTYTGTEVRPTPDFPSSAGLFGSDMETPAISRERLGLDNTGLSDIPELLDSSGDLNFLEQDHGTPVGTPENGQKTRTQRGSTEFNALSARTRAVAQYLQRQSSATPNSEQLSGNLSLNSILEHKNRKICARMFFETLVLKNCGLVDVHQEEPYEDIKLRVTPKLSKEHL